MVLRTGDFCDLVLALGPKIRYVGIYIDEIYTYKLQKNVKQYLTEEESAISVKTEVVRASLQRYVAKKVGEPTYSLTEYPKVKLITVHFSETNLLLVSTEPTADHDKIIEKILGLVRTHGEYLSEE